MSGCYTFLLNLWRLRRIDEAWIRARAPRFITEAEADEILATPLS